MDLREYLTVIKKRLSIILLITFVSTLIAFVISFLVLPNVYKASSTIYAGRQVDVQGQLAYQDILMGQTLVKDYREIAKSKLVCQAVKEELRKEESGNANLMKVLELTDEEFSKKITVNLKNDTRVIEIDVTDKDPQVCSIIANKVAFVFKEKAVALLKLENVQVVDKADIPILPVKPNKKLNVAIAFFVGLMAGLGIAFLVEYLDNTVKTPEDVTKYTELTVIGVIPKFDLIEETRSK